MRTVTKREVIEQIAKMLKLKNLVVKDVVQCFMDEMISELAKGNRLEFRDFGVFEPKQRAARHGQNPKTLERIQVPAKRTVKFKLGRVMKQKVEKSGARK